MNFRDRIRQTSTQEAAAVETERSPERSYEDITPDLFHSVDDDLFGGEADSEQLKELEAKLKKAIVVEGGVYKFGDFTLSRTSVVMPDEIDEAQAETLMNVLLKFESSLQFWLGDMTLLWLPDTDNHNEIGEAYKALAARFNLDSVNTLRDYAYVCRNVPVHVRNEAKSFSHHKLVASIKSEDDQRRWLNQAAENNWSVGAMRKQLAAAKGENKKVPSLRKRFEALEEKQLKIAKKANKNIRREMVMRLRALADSIEQTL